MTRARPTDLEMAAQVLAARIDERDKLRSRLSAEQAHATELLNGYSTGTDGALIMALLAERKRSDPEASKREADAKTYREEHVAPLIRELLEVDQLVRGAQTEYTRLDNEDCLLNTDTRIAQAEQVVQDRERARAAIAVRIAEVQHQLTQARSIDAQRADVQRQNDQAAARAIAAGKPAPAPAPLPESEHSPEALELALHELHTQLMRAGVALTDARDELARLRRIKSAKAVDTLAAQVIELAGVQGVALDDIAAILSERHETAIAQAQIDAMRPYTEEAV